jgi:hypothetical protein
MRVDAALVLVWMGMALWAQGGGVPSFGSVEVPSLGRTPEKRVGKATEKRAEPWAESGEGRGAGRCTPGLALEAREYTQPEVLGRPEGARARMCFYRQTGTAAVDTLQFYPSGHFVLTTQRGAGGFGMSGEVHGTMRGTYGFGEATLRLRTGYAGISVSQRGRGAGSERALETAGQRVLEREVVLPNCQKIRVTDLTKRVSVLRGGEHPRYLMLDGERWERQSIDCPDWQGWKRD